VPNLNKQKDYKKQTTVYGIAVKLDNSHGSKGNTLHGQLITKQSIYKLQPSYSY